MALGITETTNNGLFKNQIEIHGQYAEHIQFLKDLGVFNSIKEAYVMSAILGFKYNKKITDEAKGEKKVSIFVEQILSVQDKLILLYRIIMLTYETRGFTATDYTNRAFRDDADSDNKEKLKQNMELFNSFALGGLEFLYEKFKEFPVDGSKDDIIDIIYSIVRDFEPNIDINIDNIFNN